MTKTSRIRADVLVDHTPRHQTRTPTQRHMMCKKTIAKATKKKFRNVTNHLFISRLFALICHVHCTKHIHFLTWNQANQSLFSNFHKSDHNVIVIMIFNQNLKNFDSTDAGYIVFFIKTNKESKTLAALWVYCQKICKNMTRSQEKTDLKSCFC